MKSFSRFKGFVTVLAISVGMSCLAFNINGVPALSQVLEVKQPDGSTFNIRKKGDEWFNWTETIDQRVIIYNKANGYFEYAEIKTVDGKSQLAPSGLIVRDTDYQKPLAASGFKPVSRKQLQELRKQTLEQFEQKP